MAKARTAPEPAPDEAIGPGHPNWPDDGIDPEAPGPEPEVRCGVPDHAGLNDIANRWPMPVVGYWMDPALALGRLGFAETKAAFDAGCARWNALGAGVVLQFRESREAANILAFLGRGRRDDFDGPGGTLAWSMLPGPGTTIRTKLTQKYDADENWTPRLVEVVVAHEIGHAMGLDHSRDRRDLMYPTANGSFTGLGPGDRSRYYARYGRATGPDPPPPAGDKVVIEVLADLKAGRYALVRQP